MSDLEGHTVFDHLCGAHVPLRAAARLARGVGAALWERDEVTTASYLSPNHHTLSLYVSGGEGIVRRFGGGGRLPSLGAGSLCLMPLGATSLWDVSGPVQMLHLYLSRQALERTIVALWDRDPAAVELPERTYFRDPVAEGMIRAVLLPLDWREPALRLAVSHAAECLLAYVAGRLIERPRPEPAARGGLAPGKLRMLRAFIDAHLDRPLGVEDLAACVGLSPWHFARAFKRSTGESPHEFVTYRRIERARRAIREGMPLAEVAGACGFSSQSHFSLRFREATGTTPGEYRRAVARRLA